MKRLALLALLIASPIAAQVTPVWVRTVATLPATCDPARIYNVTDGSSGTDCSTGGGSTAVWCVCDAGGATYTGLDPTAAASGDIGDVGDCASGSCFQSETARFAFLAPTGGGVASFRALTEADISDLAHTTSAGDLTSGTIPAARVGADHIDALTELAAALRTGSDAKLVTGTAGSTDDCAKWDANGDLISAGAACGAGAGTDDQTAVEVPYTPTTGTDWVDPDPTEVLGGLDDLAGRLTIEEAKADNDTQLTQEQVEDFAGALVGDGTGIRTGVAITYQDATGDIDVVIDHDAATNFVANEHIDWTGASAGTIHATNYVDNDTIFSPNADPATDHSGFLSSLQENGANEFAGETLGTACSENQILKANASGGFDCGADNSGGGGTPNVLDLGDDASDESTDLVEIATTGDTNSIFTEPTADKLLIAVGNNWPTADTANAGDSATAFFSAGTIEHERGGLEADVSAYAGLVRIAAGATSSVTNLSGLNTALGSSIADGAHTTDTDTTCLDAGVSCLFAASASEGGAASSVANDSVPLTTATTGNYVLSITNGSGITGGDGGSEGAALTLAATLGTAIDSAEITDGVVAYNDMNVSYTIAGNPAFAANQWHPGTNGLIAEGATADTIEGLLTWAPATSDKSIALPNATGTVSLIGNTETLSGKIVVSQAADPADAGFLRGGNNTSLLCAEASPAGTDVCLTVSTAEVMSVTGGTLAATTASTATALAANGSNCSSGSAPLGVDASGAAETCTDYEEDLANSAGLLAALSDETGTGVAVFGTSPTIATPTITGNVTPTGDWDFGGGGLEIENGTTPPACTTGQIYLDTDATSGQQLMACEAGTFVKQGDGTGAGSGAFSDAGDPIVQNTTTKDVAIGTSHINTSKLSVDGDADQVQFTVQCNATQTDDCLIVEDSAGTEVVQIDETGAAVFSGAVTAASFIGSGSAAPEVSFKDSDATAGDVNARAFVNCTDVGDGTEDCDLTIAQQEAGTEKNVLVADADGGITLGAAGTDSLTVTTDGTGTAEVVLPAGSIDSTEILDGTVDISADTNLAVTAPVVLTGDTVSLDQTANYTWTGDHDFGGGGIEIENGTTPPACTVGQIYLDTDATSGQQLYACEAGTFVLQGDGGGAETNDLEATDPPTIADTEIYVGNGAGSGTFVAVSGDATLANTGALTIGADKILESHLKAVDAASDEECLTYEVTTGDFEWQTCGGGSSPLTTKGDVYTFSTVDARLAVGTNGQVLTADSAEATGLKWATAAGGSTLTDVRVSLLNNVLPDSTGDAFYESYVTRATNDFWQHGTWTFLDVATDACIYGTGMVPADYTDTADVTIIWTTQATSGNFDIQFDYRAIGGDDTESLDQATAQEQVSETDTAPSATNERKVHTIALTDGNFAVGDTIEWRLCRDATSDTIADEVQLFGLYFEYDQ